MGLLCSFVGQYRLHIDGNQRKCKAVESYRGFVVKNK